MLKEMKIIIMKTMIMDYDNDDYYVNDDNADNDVDGNGDNNNLNDDTNDDTNDVPKAREIYDTFIMRELLSNSGLYSKVLLLLLLLPSS